MLTLDINDRWIADKARSLALAQTFQRYGYPVEYNTPTVCFLNIEEHDISRFSQVLRLIFPFISGKSRSRKSCFCGSIEHSKMNRLVTALADGLLRAHEAKD